MWLCYKQKATPFGDINIINEISHDESIETECVTKAYNNPEKGIRRV